MARSWERQVRKNSTQLNKQRKKQGKPSIYSSGGAPADIYKGRNYVLPITMVALAAVYFLLGMIGQEGTAGSMTWIIMAMYVFLGLMIFLRRPFLRVEKNAVSTIKFNRDRRLAADNIAKIKLAKGSVVIEPKGKGGNWVFTRLINRYDTEAMGERLERFALTHNIPLEK
ncbi:hypothetical protein [Paenibacillus sp. XY044]|uniref:hypothetical protein n=1 Tax=Paenibacillus sp. XY044 TaxID=2026089 RepID=UPI000B98AA74|nr:hypothetical protein [Paenibacillus sp. XY044]OZB95074.1 hypothetical protein CJP46_15350 [Paenibacillus sp. XY044]